MIKLRDYQEDSISKIVKGWEEHDALLLTCATGGGKTAIFLSVIDRMLYGDQRALVLAHRQELIYQPKDRMLEYYPRWMGKIGIDMGSSHEDFSQITIATVQTLSSQKRLDGLLSHGKIDYLVVDEAHHANADSYIKLMEALKAANPNMKTLGVTATPIRADGDGLSKVFSKEAAHYGIQELIKKGWLVPVRWLGIQVGLDLSSVKTVAGDFQKGQLADVFEVDNCFDLVVESHQKYGNDRQAIAFTVSVEGAYKLAEKFNAAGIKAIAADGTTDKKLRRKILDDFASKKYQVLCNVGLYTEGLDVPEVSLIHQVRPTKSDGLYIQMIGRALRRFPGKQDALILDYCPIDFRDIVMAGDVLGTPLRKDAYMDNRREDIGDVLGGFTFDGDEYDWMDGSPADIIARQLDYLDISPWTWHRSDDGTMSISLGQGEYKIDRSLFVTAPVGGVVTLYGIGKREDKSMQIRKLLSSELDSVLEEADRIINERGNGSFVSKMKKWRKQPSSEAQIKFAYKLKIKNPETLSKGELADRITHALTLQTMRNWK